MNRLLFELQEADTLITRLKRERSKLDDGTHARSERDTLQKAHDAERTRLSALNGDRSDKELQLKSTEEKDRAPAESPHDGNQFARSFRPGARH
jgi:predicted  nucleic acid-binding Zn-ribbon protein